MNMITYIDQKNYAYYAPIIPSGMQEQIINDKDILLFGVESDSMAAGVAVVRIIGPEAQLIWFSLDPDFQGMGIGMRSFYDIVNLLKEDFNCDFMTMELPPDTESNFLNIIHAYDTSYDDLPTGRYSIMVSDVLATRRLMEKSRKCIALSDMDELSLSDLCRRIEKDNNDLVDMPIDPKRYMARMSPVYMNNGRAEGIMLLRRNTRRSMEIAFLTSFSENVNAIMDMLYFVAENLRGVGDDISIEMNLVDEELASFVRKLFTEEGREKGDFIPMQRVKLALS